MSNDATILLFGTVIGAIIGLAGNLSVSIARYYLNLSEDSVKRQRDEIYEQAEDTRKALLEGVTDAALKGYYKK